MRANESSPDGLSPTERARGLVNDLARLADDLPSPQRVFVEGIASGLDARDALIAAYPEFEGDDVPTRRLYAKISWLHRQDGVRAYLETIQGHAAYTSGLSYEKALRMLFLEGTDERSPPGVRVRALGLFAEQCRLNGIAEIEGFVGEGGSSKGTESGPIPASAANHFMQALTGKTAIPAVGAGSG